MALVTLTTSTFSSPAGDVGIRFIYQDSNNRLSFLELDNPDGLTFDLMMWDDGGEILVRTGTDTSLSVITQNILLIDEDDGHGGTFLALPSNITHKFEVVG